MIVREKYTCPIEITHDMIRGKWKTIILWRLQFGNSSLSKLKNDIVGVSQKMLLQQLNELIEYGFVGKKTFEGYPLKVEYFLTEDRGRRVLEALKVLQRLGIDYMVENGMEDVLRQRGIIG